MGEKRERVGARSSSSLESRRALKRESERVRERERERRKEGTENIEARK